MINNGDATWKEAIAELRTKVSAIEKAVELQHSDYVRVPTLLDQAVSSLKELLIQIIITNGARLDGRIDRLAGETNEKFAGTNKAVDVAFAATKETTAKIEGGFSRQFDAVGVNLNTTTTNLAGGLSDLKERLAAIESRNANSTSSASFSISLTVAAVAAIGLIITLALNLHR